MILRRLPKISFLLFIILTMSGSIILAQENQAINGMLDNNMPFLEIPLIVEESNSTISLDMHTTSGNLDTLLYLVDRNGNIVAENDDRVRGNTDSLLVFPQSEAGEYTIIATRYDVLEGSTSGEFELHIDVNPTQTETIDYALSESDLLAAGFPAIEAQEEAEWTILAYYGGDTNLESGIINDFDEFEVAGGSDESVRVIILLDRHPQFTDASGNWDSVRLFEVGADISEDHDTSFPPTLDSEPLADLGELDMGNGETLAQFLTWGIQNYPARHYAVAFASHGAGWQGLITDDSGENGTTILSIPELKQAFALAVDTADVEKFDLLINDACLMSSVEYHTGMSNYFEQSLASPEIVVNPALDMNLFTRGLRLSRGTDVDLVNLSTQLVDTYMTRDTEGNSDQIYLTNALTNLNSFDSVTEATEAFAMIVNADPSRFVSMLGQARSNAYTYTAFLGNDTLIDQGHFMQQVISLTTDPDLTLAAQEVLDALNIARVYGNAGELVARNTSYYNIYFPAGSRQFQNSYFAESDLQEWARMLRNYFNLLTPQQWIVSSEASFHSPLAPTVSLTSIYPEVANIHNPINIHMDIIGRGVAQGTFIADRILEDGTVQRLNISPILTEIIIDDDVDYINVWDSGVDVSTIIWDTFLPVVSDGTISNPELIIDSDLVSSLEGRYREPESEVWINVSVIFDIDGEVQRIVSRNTENSALGVVDQIPPGSEFQTYRAIVTVDGRTVQEPGTIYTWQEYGLRLDSIPAPSGDYKVGILVTTFGGTTAHDSVVVTIDNDNLDSTFLGYTEESFGFTIVYPTDWIEPAYFPDDNYIQSQDDEGDNQMTIYILDEDSSNLEDLMYDFADFYFMELIDSDPLALNIGGLDALEFEYFYETDDGFWDARAFIVYHEELDLPMVFAIETFEGANIADEVYELMKTDSSFFTTQSSSTWVRDFYTDETSYAVPASWLEGIEDEFWLRYSPDADPDSPTFVVVSSFELDSSDMMTVLDGILEESGVNALSDYNLTDTRTYRAQHLDWEVALYTASRDVEAVIGRMYVTSMDDYVYTMWFETVNNEDAPRIFQDIFELILDSFVLENILE